MPIIKFDLQDGFVNDSIIIRVGGKEVFRKQKVTTRTQIGYADSFQASVEEGTVNISIDVPTKHLSESLVLQISKAIHVGISFRGGKVVSRISEEPFGYL